MLGCSSNVMLNLGKVVMKQYYVPEQKPSWAVIPADLLKNVVTDYFESQKCWKRWIFVISGSCLASQLHSWPTEMCRSEFTSLELIWSNRQFEETGHHMTFKGWYRCVKSSHCFIYFFVFIIFMNYRAECYSKKVKGRLRHRVWCF